MKSNAVILRQVGGKWETAEIDIDAPRPREVLIEIKASSLCHSEDHAVTGAFGDLYLPTVGGHEAAGVVVEVGNEVTLTKVGSRVLADPMSACGRCRWCSQGQTYLCDLNAYQLVGTRPDGTYKYHVDGKGASCIGQVGAFSQYALVGEDQAINIDDDISFEAAALASCGVQTGYGAALHGAKVASGDIVAVVGTGGVGMSAVQGARICGASYIIAIDPVQFKRDEALKFGATHTSPSMAEARELISQLTRGVMADKVIITVGECTGDMFFDINSITAKGGTVVCTSVIPSSETALHMPVAEFVFSHKTLVGNVRGLMNARADLPKLFDLYRAGKLKLDEMITTTYKLDGVQQGYDDMHAGKNIRGVVIL
jgi:S-(hydroxymethyl)glutathione dehydrogenase/alcohol dehydrogenase